MDQSCSPAPNQPLDMPGLLEILARSSARPRYAFMVLNLIAQISGPDGRAGPLVVHNGVAMPLRDWLCDALMPMGHRDPKRQALVERVQTELASAGSLPGNGFEASQIVEREVRRRVRASGKTNVSRAVSDLVRAGMLSRHYQGFRVDHHNRGGQRQAVYTLSPVARMLLRSRGSSASKPSLTSQTELPLGR